MIDRESGVARRGGGRSS